MVFKKRLFIYFRERERQHEWEGQRERKRESQADFMLSTEVDTGLDFRILRSGPEPKLRVRRLTNYATQASLLLNA